MENLKQIKSRQPSIDLLECIAIFLVLLYHSTLYASNIIVKPSALSYSRYFFQTLISPCVSLFFFANGYLLFNRKFDLTRHINKTIKLIILTGVWGLGKILILMPIKKEYLSVPEIIYGVWDMKQGWINSLWFMAALVCIYIFFPLLKQVYDTNKKVFNYFVIVCFILTFGNVLLNECGTVFLTQVLHKSKVIHGADFFNNFNPFRGMHGYTFVSFCVGAYFYDLKEKILTIKPHVRNILCIAVMIISCSCLWGIGICYSKATAAKWDVVWNGYDTVFTFLNVICIYILCLNLKKDIKIIRIISCNTMGIYFIHEIFINLTQNYIKEYNALRNIPFNIIYAIIILFASLAVTLLIKRTPVLKKLIN